MLAAVCGPQYIYPTYASSLATKFQWTALENSFVASACFLGISFSGPICSWIIEHVGFQLTLRLAAVFGFLGNFLLAQTYNGRLPSHFQLCVVYLIVIGFSSSAAYLCCLDSQSHNFRHHRGMAMGITSAVLGLAGLMFSQINDHFFKAQVVGVVSDNDNGSDDTYQFLLFVSVVTAVFTFIPSFVLGPLPECDDDHAIKTIDGHTAQYQDIRISPSDIDDDGCSNNRTLVDDDDADDTPLLADNIIQKPANYTQNVVIVDDEPCQKRNPSISGMALFTHPIGITLFTALFVVLGLGYVYLASVGQILQSLPSLQNSNPQHLRNTHVSIFSLSNCASRIVFGTLSDILKNRFGLHRLWVYWAGILGLIICQLYLVTFVSSAETLIPCTIGMALVYGLSFGIAPAAAAEFGTNVMWNINNAIITLLIY
ncbi:major facilitator superfamily domain-containing protein [Absidia repens]|uniref:Major facilitator superfamily domain-containing protein n=1 Tax=Absidia repens TaxID=90262 RepID=A0A1X2IR18_9FUNG|nr:major facilitator superfamily domain-containing protein [Absidia repens]